MENEKGILFVVNHLLKSFGELAKSCQEEQLECPPISIGNGVYVIASACSYGGDDNLRLSLRNKDWWSKDLFLAYYSATKDPSLEEWVKKDDRISHRKILSSLTEATEEILSLMKENLHSKEATCLKWHTLS